jgi:alpha-tubulin suppressor-like RCC1 family protein
MNRCRARSAVLALAASAWLAAGGVGCTRSVRVFELEDAGGTSPEPDAASDASDIPSGEARALAAFEQTCVADQGALFCWGRNSSGQLGLGSSAPSLVPTRAERAPAYDELCAGEVHSCGLRADGLIDCWGGNDYGQLGQGDQMARSEPTPLSGSPPKFEHLECGGRVTCAIAEGGALYCWGDNGEGELGLGDTASMGHVSTPTRTIVDPPVEEVSVGQGHACAIVQGGALFCWGRNDQGQIGLGTTSSPARSPKAVGSELYRRVAAGQQHTCAVRADGHLFCWGSDLDGRLGLGTSGAELSPPAQVGGASDYSDVRANWFHTCALRARGRLECWGRNLEGQLGQGDSTARSTPSPVGSESEVWSGLVVGHFHTCALRQGAVYCWGKNDEHQLGMADGMNRTRPAWVRLPAH